MSSEQRVVRPYPKVDAVQKLLDAVVLGFGGARIAAGGRLRVGVDSFLTDPLSVIMSADENGQSEFVTELLTAVDDAGLKPDQVELVLLLTTPRLRIAEVVWRQNLTELADVPPRVVVGGGDERPAALQAPFGGCRARFMALLAESVDPQPLRPVHRGTWLGRAEYTIDTQLGDSGFTLIPLTDEVRAEHRLHADTLRFVLADRVTDPEMDASDAMSVYIDEDVLARLASEPNSRGARSFQQQLFLDAMTTVIYSGSLEMAAGESPESFMEGRDSLLGRLVSRVATREHRVDTGSAQSYWEAVRDDPGRFVSLVEGWLPNFKKSLIDSLKDSDR